MNKVVRGAPTLGEELTGLLPSWRRHLRAENKSPRTVQSYTEAAEQFSAFLVDRGMPTGVTKLSREHLEAFLEHRGKEVPRGGCAADVDILWSVVDEAKVAFPTQIVEDKPQGF